MRLTVLLATHHPWPAVQTCLEPLTEQAHRLGVQVVVADGDGRGLPADHPFAEHLVVPGADVFTLRATALAHARGDVIALTEDHCAPANDWCDRILAAHEEHPGADVIGGAVDNGTPRGIADRANFFFTFGEFVAPIRQDLVTRCPPPANVSIKRRVLDTATGEPGWLELVAVPHAFRAGRVALDDRIRVCHHQPVTTRKALAAHFHNGRSSSGLVVAARRGATVPAAVRRWGVLGTESLRVLWRKGHRRAVLRDGAAVLAVSLAHCCGELVGLVRGPGNSAHRLD